MRTTPELEAVANAAERQHAQLIGLIVTSGWYRAPSQLINAARVELEALGLSRSREDSHVMLEDSWPQR